MNLDTKNLLASRRLWTIFLTDSLSYVVASKPNLASNSVTEYWNVIIPEELPSRGDKALKFFKKSISRAFEPDRLKGGISTEGTDQGYVCLPPALKNGFEDVVPRGNVWREKRFETCPDRGTVGMRSWLVMRLRHFNRADSFMPRFQRNPSVPSKLDQIWIHIHATSRLH